MSTRACPVNGTRILIAAVLLFVGAPKPAAAQGVKSVQAANAKLNLVWPLPPDKPRIRFLEMFSNNFEIEPRKKKSWVDRMVGNPDQNVTEYFEKPAGVAVDSQGRMLIASTQKATVYILSKEKHEVIRLHGDRGMFLNTPLGLAVDRQDNIYVGDVGLKQVLKFSSQGQLLATSGTDAGFKNPVYMALDENRGRLYVVDSHLHQVIVLNPETFEVIARVGRRGGRNGEFNFPVGVGVAPDGSFAVTDTGSCSVQIFSPDFKFLRRFGKQGTQPGDFVRPKGVAYDSEGHLYVMDASFNNMQIFNDKGQILMFVGAFGGAPGTFNLPNGIYIDKENRIYVSDQLNHRVQIFQFLGGE